MYILLMVVVVGLLSMLAVSAPLLVEHWAKRKSLKQAGIPEVKGPKLSHPAKVLLKEFNALPAENRPAIDIMAALRGLDVEHSHPLGCQTFEWEEFSSRSCRHYRYSASYGSKCELERYHRLQKEIENVAQEIKERDRILAMQASQHGLDEAKRLYESLREESHILKSVNKELFHVE